MRLLHCSAVALVALSTIAYAKDKPLPAHARQAYAQAPGADSYAPSGRIHRSGNSCAPDRAEPAWGPHNELMGYTCEPDSANGG